MHASASTTLPPVRPVTLRINGQDRTVPLAPWTTLLDALREYLNLTGTKKGCDHGQCGACTVLVDGKRINACLTLAVMHEGRSITTIEGLAENGRLHPVQQAFIDHDAFQCGYCTPGQICSAVGLLAEGHLPPDPDGATAHIRELMSGNLCRCGAYPQIVDAIRSVMPPPAAGNVVSTDVVDAPENGVTGRVAEPTRHVVAEPDQPLTAGVPAR